MREVHKCHDWLNVEEASCVGCWQRESVRRNQYTRTLRRARAAAAAALRPHRSLAKTSEVISRNPDSLVPLCHAGDPLEWKCIPVALFWMFRLTGTAVHLYLGNSPSYWLGAECSGDTQGGDSKDRCRWPAMYGLD
jgi:hypothetical protein